MLIFWDHLGWGSHVQCSVQFSRSVVSDFLWPHGLRHARPLCPSPLLKFTQTHVHWVSDAIQPSHPLSSPSPPVFNLSQHQGLFTWLSSGGRSQDGGGIGRGDHFLSYKFIKRTIERWTKFTKQLLIASSGHQAPKWLSSSYQVDRLLGVSALASVLPMNIQDWFPLGWTGLILLSKRLSRVSSNTTVQKHQFFATQLSL